MPGTILEELRPDIRVTGVHPHGAVEVVAVKWHGDQAVTLTYRTEDGAVHQRMLFRNDEAALAVAAPPARRWSLRGDARLFRLAAEARRIRLAHLFDPYLALESSQVRPLPHQIEAVYGEMLPRRPLRFLLADDPGAGKTVMAGLYIKELMIRGGLERCLVIAPGNLTVQWQEELRHKFGLEFEIVAKEHLDAIDTVDVFERRPLLIARIDQLARRQEQLEPALRRAEWDLVVVDEAHRMAAHFWGDEIRKTLRYQLGETVGASAQHLLLMTATPHNGKEEDFQLFLALLDSDQFAGRFRDGAPAADTSSLMRRMVKERLVTFEGRPLFPERRSSTVKYRLSEQEMRLYDEVTGYVQEQMNAADRLAEGGDGRRGNTVGFALTVLQRRLASSPEAIFQSLRRRRRRLELRVAEERSTARAARLGLTTPQQRLSQLLQADPATANPTATAKPATRDTNNTDSSNTNNTNTSNTNTSNTAADNTDNTDNTATDNTATTAAGDILGGLDLDDYDELDDSEQAEIDAEVVDAATAAETIAELESEIRTLERLEQMARDLRMAGTDAKWQQLSDTLSEASEMRAPDGARHKLIVFTEHRDTLVYLVERLRTFLGDPQAVVRISGSTRRDERRAVQHRFTQDPGVLVLVATDAAGEGINLQQAHLVVNYDLPWNPNRIEQRFGRVHRIGQTEVCHMWSLVADETREAQVYLRLLDKIEQMSETFQGQVYDVLGEALSGRELRLLLLDAIRYGDRPEVRSRLDRIIETDVPQRVAAAIKDPVLATDAIGYSEVDRIRRDMDEASLRRIQPHDTHAFFTAAFAELGGRLDEREPGRYQIHRVPLALRSHDRGRGRAGAGPPVGPPVGPPLLERYTRITFRKELAEVRGAPDADLVAPGHPLLDAVVDLTLERHRHHISEGAVLADDADEGAEPRVMVMLEHEVADARPTRTAGHTVVSRRFEFVEMSQHGGVSVASHARYLDYRPLTDDERAAAEPFLADGWLARDFEQEGLDHAIENSVPVHLAEVRARTLRRVETTRRAVHERLTKEVNHWDNRAAQLQLDVDAGRTPRMNADTARRRAEDYSGRLKRRLAELDREMTITALPPKVVGGALVLPAGLLSQLRDQPDAAAATAAAAAAAATEEASRREVEQRAINAVLRAEAAQGWYAQDMNESHPNHPGYDVRSERRSGTVSEFRYIEVKGRVSGAETVTLTRNEILNSLNEPERWLLALVEAKPEGTEEVRYLHRPIEAGAQNYLFEVTSINFNWKALWSRGQPPNHHHTNPTP